MFNTSGNSEIAIMNGTDWKTPGANSTLTNLSSVFVDDPDIPMLDPFGDYSLYYEGDIENLKKPWLQEPHFIPTVSVYGIAFLLGLIGNSLVIFAMVGDRKSRSVTASFMVSLAVADLLFLLVCVPFETSRYFIGHWEIGPILCKLSGTVEMVSALASILNLTAVSIERYIVIVHPMKARTLCTLGNTKKILPCVWIVAVGLSAPTFHVMNTVRMTYYDNDTTVMVIVCGDTGVQSDDRLIFCVYQFIAMFAAPTLIMVFCYMFVIHVLWISSRQLLNLTTPMSESKSDSFTSDDTLKRLTVLDTPTQTRHWHRCRRNLVNRATREHSVEVLRARRQVIKMLITIIIVFLLCWGPKLIIRILQRRNSGALWYQSALITKIVLDCLPYIQSCLNPIIYGFMSRNFRKSMQTACRTYVCKESYTHSCLGRKLLGSDYELESRATCSNGTIHTKISLRTRSSSSDD
ncbi:QRFP-like peptide receptor [Haliotis cracherodii]|uniref:QRFP-like peptide receptor n=1 Tax=Haliotis cracherodii TaxID=6455 RepID=UPI0039EAFC96